MKKHRIKITFLAFTLIGLLFIFFKGEDTEKKDEQKSEQVIENTIQEEPEMLVENERVTLDSTFLSDQVLIADSVIRINFHKPSRDWEFNYLTNSSRNEVYLINRTDTVLGSSGKNILFPGDTSIEVLSRETARFQFAIVLKK